MAIKTACLLLALLHPLLTSSQATGYVSIKSDPAYTTLRPCAASCLVYQGVFACGVNKGYYDLGLAMGCDCSALNLCYCKSSDAAIASSYISSCVSKGCSSFPTELPNAISLYNAYCLTANVAVSTTTSASSTVASLTSRASSTSATTPTPTSRTGSTAAERQTTAASQSTPPASTEMPVASTSTDSGKGLSQSDVIALAVGLGVGIPSLLLALATFCMQRKRKEKERRLAYVI